MKGVKIVEVNTDNGCVEETGTCELCFGSDWCDNPEITIEYPDGVQDTFDGYFWDWGAYYELRVDNWLNFSAWLQEQDFDRLRFEEDSFSYFSDLINQYDEETDGY